MIVDTSVLVCIHDGEPEARRYLEVLLDEPSPRISAGSLLEASIVLDARQPLRTSRRLDRLVADLRLDVVPVDEQQVSAARAAYRDYGKGSGHAAGLNFGDCFAYALAATTGEPLLFKGDDFTHTDVLPVV
ncbi:MULTISPECIES: type II toxin-antitoxin system VapC family toxin [Janibacter]|uniref:Ribonuclease VapC n=1 Tax=Janibacter indicus TaxID=857417 RepID=A0A1W2AWZ8_9MICO|nr:MULTISPECIES: type II toxin-antitoxin system VapC family toxin [Janibacter]QNF94208.1 type II toxin-antitoxin system VapC family toxin [Janibacter sp. YB324]SMC64961.1 ribonuclease VapC [Janibacter indicus]